MTSGVSSLSLGMIREHVVWHTGPTTQLNSFRPCVDCFEINRSIFPKALDLTMAVLLIYFRTLVVC
jgi:hypothetical protein